MLQIGVGRTPIREAIQWLTRDGFVTVIPRSGTLVTEVTVNEPEVGAAIRRSGIDRSDVFIETKAWISDYGYDQTLHAFDKSTRKLGIDRLDLFILHQPLPSQFDLTVDAYRALETLLADGRVRAIGVSNFMPEHLERLLAETTVVPAVNQIELHPTSASRSFRRWMPHMAS